VPSDVIIDASIPGWIRESGRMWGPDGKLHDTLAAIPDRSYARLFSDGHRRLASSWRVRSKDHGLGPNVGLMAQQARYTARTTRRSKFPRANGSHASR